ncbi:MAG: ATP synthase F1 subunit gamma [Oscillospiraceae bacterium]|nr:ATP synthase F1 subunit gamma [Oscillospiraceae bacterium]
MPSIKMIKRRLVSVKNTQQIMKAMNLVAASKLQKNKSKLDSIRPLYENIKLFIDEIRAGGSFEGDAEGSVFVEGRDVKNIAYVILSSDRGLCGGYNINISKTALAHIEANKDKQEKIIAIGTKGWDYFRRRGKNIVQKSEIMSEAAIYDDAQRIGELITSMFISGEVDEVYLAYTHFESVLSHTPRVEKLLPIEEAPESKKSGAGFVTYDPDIGAFITYAVPMYLSMYIYGAIVESAVCEQASRMTSMDAAARNASEIIEDLTLEFNRKRQGMITQEITEIVGGANAQQ